MWIGLKNPYDDGWLSTGIRQPSYSQGHTFTCEVKSLGSVSNFSMSNFRNHMEESVFTKLRLHFESGIGTKHLADLNNDRLSDVTCASFDG